MFRNHAYLQEAEFPSRLGYEAAGIVVAVGSAVTGIKVGDAVALIPPLDIARWGTYGELANVPAHLVVKSPERLSLKRLLRPGCSTSPPGVHSSSRPNSGNTTLSLSPRHQQCRSGCLPDSTHGRRHTTAITRTRAKKQALLDAGAAYVIVSDEEDIVERVMEITTGQGARVVFDPVGGRSFEPLTQSMARGGILLVYGALSSEPTPFPLFTVLGKSLTLKGYLYAEIVADPEVLERAKAFILQGLESGALSPIIAKTFPLSDIQEAHRFLRPISRLERSW